MRYAYSVDGSDPIGVEPQIDKRVISIQSFDGTAVVEIDDAGQLDELIWLLQDAERILNRTKGKQF